MPRKKDNPNLAPESEQALKPNPEEQCGSDEREKKAAPTGERTLNGEEISMLDEMSNKLMSMLAGDLLQDYESDPDDAEEVAAVNADADTAENASGNPAFGLQSDGTVLAPVIPLRDAVFFDGENIRFEMSREASRAALRAAKRYKCQVFLVAQRNADKEEPLDDDLFPVGVLAEVTDDIRMPDDLHNISVSTKQRAYTLELVRYRPYLKARVKPHKTIDAMIPELREAYLNVLKMQFEEISDDVDSIPNSYKEAIRREKALEPLVNRLASHMVNDLAKRVELLAEDNLEKRARNLLKQLLHIKDMIGLESRLRMEVYEQIDKNQKEYFLREQLRAIHSELGDRDGGKLDEFRKKLRELPLNDEAREKLTRELDRLETMQPESPESDVQTTYIEWVLSLPWGVQPTVKIDIGRARKVLDGDHYGLDKVKERLIEYLSVRSLKKDMKGPCICLVGPPGVGKTSIAHSIATALKRPLAHVSLGGVHDEAEIRGHRRTYVGSMPGRVMAAMRRAGSMSPVFLFDEIDKMGMDYRGDPASAMLEVLDGEQNNAFRDHYLDVPFDLSNVLFILTANSLDRVPRPLLDRMEIIEIEGYTAAEKLEIAKRHLLKKQLKENGLDGRKLRIKDESLSLLIEEYTREAGVRQLEREIGALCRKTACRFVDDPKLSRVTISPKEVRELLGHAKFKRVSPDREPETGVVNGLAWTEVGGETLSVEAAVMPGSGHMELTGQLGDVMQESARAALSVIRMRSDELGLAKDFYKSHDLHIHVPEGAVPKDGPSAGVTITCALASALTGRPARQDVAMTGEITLRGRVLPIGGVKEKVLAAHRMGMRTVLLPRDNEGDIEDIPAEIRDHIELKLISSVYEALDAVLLQPQNAAQAAQ